MLVLPQKTCLFCKSIAISAAAAAAQQQHIQGALKIPSSFCGKTIEANRSTVSATICFNSFTDASPIENYDCLMYADDLLGRQLGCQKRELYSLLL